MKVYRRIENFDLRDSELPVALSIGNFDGVHSGHQEVIRILSRGGKKNNFKTCILTFEPHPKKILFNPEFRVLHDFEEKCSALSLLDIDILIAQPFDRYFSRLSVEDFVQSMLRHRINTKHVVVGKDFSCGADKSGNAEDLKEILKKYNIGLTVVPPFFQENVEVHSNMIRVLIQNGQIEEANRYLFSTYSLSGKVVHGKCRGAELGYPTINFYNEAKVIPARGVYITRSLVDGVYYNSITNIGNCPTFGSGNLRIETHILNFDADLYGKYVQLFFYDKIRNEQKFPSREALSEQIRKDIEIRKSFKISD